MKTADPLEVLVSKRKIAAAVRRLAEEIRRDYLDKNPILIGVLRIFHAAWIFHWKWTSSAFPATVMPQKAAGPLKWCMI